MSISFEQLGLKKELVDALSKAGINQPTKIQEIAIPSAIENKDIIGQSETGTGKTLAYLLPIFQKLNAERREMQALILAPTHELVMQINKEVERLSSYSGIGVASAAIIGDVNIARQVEKLKEKPQVIVGSTGRVLELIKKKKITAHTIKTIVIDEADRLLDKNNIENVKAVIKTTLKERQLMMFSATMSPGTIDSANQLMKDPEIVKAEVRETVNSSIVHYYFLCEKRDKIEILRKLVHALNPKRALVFINRSDDIQITTAKLKYHKLNVEGIHGSNEKEERKKALEYFRTGKIQLLVASDIAARGLDIADVTHIFNLDIPEDPKDYLHRAGRTGRAGQSGVCISLIDASELYLIKKYQNAYNIRIDEKDMYMGRVIDK